MQSKIIKKLKSFLSYSLKLFILTSFLLSQSFVAEIFLYQNNPNTKSINTAKADYNDHWYNTSWLYRKQITINHTNIPHTDTNNPNAYLSNFPVLISTNIPTDKARSDHNDIVFASCDTSACSVLSYEIESYDTANGNLTAWIKVPQLNDVNNTQDTSFYMYYGNSSHGTSDLENKAGVWNSDFKGVWHLGDTPSGHAAGDYKDSTVNVNNSTNTTNEPTATILGQMDGAQSFNGTGQYINAGNNSSLNITNAVTVEAWIYPRSSGGGGLGRIADKANYQLFMGNGQSVTFNISSGGIGKYASTPGTQVKYNQWTQVIGVFDGSNVKVYANAVLTTGQAAASIDSSAANRLYLGDNGAGTRYFDGYLDEIRISNIARSTDWITTEYNNQSHPSTFYTLGEEENNFPPVLAEVASVPTPANKTTPSYTFSSTKSGTITYSGDCSSITTSAVSGNNSVVFNALSSGIHSNCALKITDGLGNDSNTLLIPRFTINTSITWHSASWLYRKQISIDHTAIPHTDTNNPNSYLSNFPVLISISNDANLKFAPTGKVSKADGSDIIFADQTGIQMLNYEIESYDGVNGSLTAWVKIPQLKDTHNAQDTVLYMYYGNSGAGANAQANLNSAWDGDFKGVWHLKETGSVHAGDFKDSTVNANNSINTADQPSLVTSGKINDAESFDGSSSYVEMADSQDLRMTNGGTISAWIYPKSLGGGNAGRIIEKSGGDITKTYQLFLTSNNRLDFSSANSTGTFSSNDSITFNQWQLVNVVFNSSGRKIYINGTDVTASGGDIVSLPSDIGSTVRIGNRLGTNDRGFDGYIDEVRVSSVTRSADWIKTEYDNESSPSNFYALGEEEAQGDYYAAKNIVAFNFNGLSPTIAGTINETDHTISFIVPYGTDVTILVPTITIAGASVSPASGSAHSFINPVDYTVTAYDSNTQIYTVTVTVAPATATTYTITSPAPASGSVCEASGNFTITPNSFYTGAITIIPSGGGLSTPIIKTFAHSRDPQTFTITPSSAGRVTLTSTNDGGLDNPFSVIYMANWSFITRSGNTLQNNGGTFKFSGANMHWLGLMNINHGVAASPPTHFQIDDAMQTAQEMGMRVVRSHTLGISTGGPNSIEPSLDRWNDAAFESIDYAIQSARSRGVHLIIPLTDDWHYYKGGKYNFTDWENLDNEDDFYTNAAVLQDFENYTSHLLNHVNQYTGIALKDDPTIMAWETGNELNTTITWSVEQDAWTQTIATYIKSIDSNHLVADGHTAGGNANSQFTANQLQNSAIDMLTDHFYPPNISVMQRNAAAAVAAGKVYYIGEYDWTDQLAVPAAGSISQDDSLATDGIHAVNIGITKANQIMAYYIQLLSDTFALQENTQYTISFDAKASNNNIVYAGLVQRTFPNAVYANNAYNFTPSWQHYSFTYTPTSTYSSVAFRFNLAANTGNVWVDNVSVSDGGSNLIGNPSFENTGDSWLSPWLFQVRAGGDTLEAFLPKIESIAGISGDLFWDLYGHNDIQGYDNNDAYTFHYPGDTSDYEARAQLLRTHNFAMKGITSPPAHIIPMAPVINSITTNGPSVTVDWRGSAGAASYNLQQSSDGINWNTVATGFVDTIVPNTISVNTVGSYRLVPLNLDGLTGLASNSVSANIDTSSSPFIPPTKPNITNINITVLDNGTTTFNLPSNITQIAISRTPDFANVSWQDFDQDKFSHINETQETLYIKLRTNEGAVSDTIIITPQSSINNTISLIDGDIIQCKSSNDPNAVYIVKIIGNKTYIRHITSIQIFNYYKHLKWENLKQVDSLTPFSLSSWIRVNTNTNGLPKAGDKVYEINGDQTKHWINMTAQQFLTHGGSDEAIYTVNSGELNLYSAGADVVSL